MDPVRREEILGLAEYEAIRPQFRARVIEEKKRRRVAVGPSMTFVFENHDTVLFQVQEMLRTERITRPAAVQHEIDTYNELVPKAGELSATAMVEIPDPAQREAFLAAAKGLERKIALLVGDRRVDADIEADRVLPDRASAVMYLKFRLPADLVAAVRGGARLRLVVDHTAYNATADLGQAVTSSLAEDLA